MPLAAAAFEAGIAALTGAGSPASRADAAQAWADATQAMFTGVVPLSTTVAAAAATLKTALESAFADNPSKSAFAASLEAAFAAFATTVAGGMLPLYTGVPPVAPVGFAALLATDKASLAEAAAAWADAVEAWALTGTATLVAPPFTPVTWT